MKIENFLSWSPDTYSDLETIETILSDLKGLKAKPNNLTKIELKNIEKLESKWLRLKEAVENPKEYMVDLFDDRTNFFRLGVDVTPGYLDFFSTYLLCCHFAIKYRKDLRYSFPPNKEDYKKFAELWIEAYNHSSKPIKGLEGLERYSRVNGEFYKGVDRRFDNIPLDNKDSFKTLAYYCIDIIVLMEIMIPSGINPIPSLESDSCPNAVMRRFAENGSGKWRTGNEKLVERWRIGSEKLVERYSLSLICRAQQLIGYWTKEIETWKNLQKKAQIKSPKVERMKTDIKNYDMTMRKRLELALKYEVTEMRIRQLEKEVKTEKK